MQAKYTSMGERVNDDDRAANVLFVDDNASNALLYQQVSKRIPGCVAKCLTDPQEALIWGKSHQPAIVIVDYRMPQMNGIEFIRSFREIPGRNTVPFVMLTAISEPAVQREAIQLGVVAFLPKPANLQSLIGHITKALAHLPKAPAPH